MLNEIVILMFKRMNQWNESGLKSSYPSMKKYLRAAKKKNYALGWENMTDYIGYVFVMFPVIPIILQLRKNILVNILLRKSSIFYY